MGCIDISCPYCNKTVVHDDDEYKCQHLIYFSDSYSSGVISERLEKAYYEWLPEYIKETYDEDISEEEIENDDFDLLDEFIEFLDFENKYGLTSVVQSEDGGDSCGMHEYVVKTIFDKDGKKLPGVDYDDEYERAPPNKSILENGATCISHFDRDMQCFCPICGYLVADNDGESENCEHTVFVHRWDEVSFIHDDFKALWEEVGEDVDELKDRLTAEYTIVEADSDSNAQIVIAILKKDL
jgi:uncharacterized Zn finger protein (UPF0148 family)